MSVLSFKVAEAPAKGDLLAFIDNLRAQIECGEILALIAIPILPNKEFQTLASGPIGALEMSAMLLRATLDAQALLCR